nr:unnamed protein product [Callosobruchus analis]
MASRISTPRILDNDKGTPSSSPLQSQFSYHRCCNQSCENHLLVICCAYKDKFKHTCVDITLNEVRILNAYKGHEWTCVTCRAVGKDLKDLKSLIIQLQNDIKKLKAEKFQPSSISVCHFENIISETTERLKRKKYRHIQ